MLALRMVNAARLISPMGTKPSRFHQVNNHAVIEQLGDLAFDDLAKVVFELHF